VISKAHPRYNKITAYYQRQQNNQDFTHFKYWIIQLIKLVSCYTKTDLTSHKLVFSCHTYVGPPPRSSQPWNGRCETGEDCLYCNNSSSKALTSGFLWTRQIMDFQGWPWLPPTSRRLFAWFILWPRRSRKNILLNHMTITTFGFHTRWITWVTINYPRLYSIVISWVLTLKRWILECFLYLLLHIPICFNHHCIQYFTKILHWAIH
jgi:hypothetical protein